MLRWELGQVNAGVPVLADGRHAHASGGALEDRVTAASNAHDPGGVPSSTQPGTFPMPLRGGVLAKFMGERGAARRCGGVDVVVAAAAGDRGDLLFASTTAGHPPPERHVRRGDPRDLEYFASLGRLAAVAFTTARRCRCG